MKQYREPTTEEGTHRIKGGEGGNDLLGGGRDDKEKQQFRFGVLIVDEAHETKDGTARTKRIPIDKVKQQTR